MQSRKSELSIVGLILARGGSKRIPNKNIKDLKGKPLIAWTIETAIRSKAFTHVFVSTDNPKIAEVALEYGAEVPWLRPDELATDESLSIQAVLHASNWMTTQKLNVDGIMLLQPTSPFRTVKTISFAIELFQKSGLEPVVSFSQADISPEWCFRREGDRLTPIMGWEAVKTRSQDIQPTLQLNGLVYLASPRYLARNLTFLGPTTVPLVCNEPREAIDIDTYLDWTDAENILTCE